MSNRHKDFDQFFAEKKKEPVTLTIFGETHELAPALPAMVMLELIRMQKKHGDMGEVPESELISLALTIFSEELFEHLCKKGLDVEQLGELIKWAMSVYTGKSLDDSEAGDAAKKS